MIKKTLILITGMALSLSAYAQEDSDTISTESKAETKVMASKGIRVSLFKPFLKTRVKVRAEGFGVTVKDSTDRAKVDSIAGIGVGYAYIPVRNIGIDALFSFINMDEIGGEDSDGLNMLRLEGSATYAFTNQFHVKGGLNLSHLIGDSDASDIDTGAGLQVGVGYQINKQFGIDLKYALMRQVETVTNSGVEVEAEVETTGIEIGLNATF